MNVTKLKDEAQRELLKKLCAQISTLSDDWLEGTAEDLLVAVVGVLDDQSQDDAWGTEGWEHFFGLD